MGDRANVFFPKKDPTDTEDGVFLYTHWGGSNLPLVVQKVLQKKLRWDHDDYLARMIFCAMVKGEEDDELGYGISSVRIMDEHPLIVMDCNNQQVGFMSLFGDVRRWFSFDEYIAMNEEAILELYRKLR